MPYIGNEVGNRFVASKAASVYSGNGSTTAFTLEHAVGSDEDILVSVDGVIQEPSVAYAVSSGTTLTFTAAPSSNSGNNIFVYYLFRTVGTVDHPSTSSLQATDATFTGAVTANAGVVVDNITIDGTEIDLSSGDLTVDVAGNILLNADGGGVYFQDASTLVGSIQNSSSDLVITSEVQDKDILFKGDDGGSSVTALTLDMADAGTALFNHDIKMPNGGNIYFLASSGYSPIISNSSDTNSLSIFTGNNQRMNIDGNGHITMPNQSAFLIGMSSNSGTYGNGLFTPTLDTEIFDQNADFGSNTFTAPVTGRYQLSWLVYAGNLDTAASYYYLRIQTSNRDYTKYLYTHSFDADVAYYGWGTSILADMDVNDTATFHIGQVNGHSNSIVYASNTYASGALIC